MCQNKVDPCSMHGQQILQEYARSFDPLLRDFFKKQSAAYAKKFDTNLHVLENLEEFCLRGGKRLRPALVACGYKLFGKEVPDDVITVSLGVELMHVFLLIHDDIMDESSLRRGRAAVHKFYEREYRTYHYQNGGSIRFGRGAAILAGDLAQFLALDLFLQSNLVPESKIRVMKKMSETVKATIFGQALDIHLEAKGTSTFQDILRMYYLKTAQYSFECPLQIGAQLAGGTEKDMKIISSYAIPLGTAFQIQDDILGVFGNEQETGKKKGDDIKQGKQTVLVARAFEKGSKADRIKMQALLGKKDLQEHELQEFQHILEKTGTLSYVKSLSKRYVRRAGKALQRMREQKYNEEAVEALKSISDFTTERNT